MSKERRTNMIVRMEMKRCGIAQWQLAEALGVHENTVQRLLRRELPTARQKELLKAVRQAAGGAK